MEQTPECQTLNTTNIECPNIKLSKHHILVQNRTSNMSNITKNWTVHENHTVHSKTSKHLTKFHWVNWYMALYVSLGGSNGCQICCMHLFFFFLQCQEQTPKLSRFSSYSILWWLFCSVRRKTKYCNWMPTFLLVGK